MVVAQRGSIKDLDHCVDSDVCADEGIFLAEAYCQVIGVWYVPNDGQCPDGELINAVVFVVADDQDSMLASSAQQGPDLSPAHHWESRSAMSLLLSIRSLSASACWGVWRRMYSPYA